MVAVQTVTAREVLARNASAGVMPIWVSWATAQRSTSGGLSWAPASVLATIEAPAEQQGDGRWRWVRPR
jgi:hypothetical protein